MSKFMYRFILFVILLGPLLIIGTCKQPRYFLGSGALDEVRDTIKSKSRPDTVFSVIKITKDVKIKNYFPFMDSLVLRYNSLVPYQLTEHLLVQANPWIIDSLADTDYYKRMEKNQFIYDQKELVILHVGDSLLVPDNDWAKRLQIRQSKTLLDINIPAFTLTILEDHVVLYRFLVRVGQDHEKYLETAGRIENLRTRTGTGIIAKITRDPTYVNPVDGYQYESTGRDDGRRTKLPQIPFLHPEINGYRWGQLIHPTTTRETLGKAYSNGCIGTGEGDAWRIYYHAPVGTAIRIRYDLKEINQKGDTLKLRDIYPAK